MLNPPLNPIYLDHAATTPLRPEVLEAMRPYWGERFGNPSSVHRRGQKARAAVEGARRVLAELLGAPPSAVVFTGSGTEANNLALRGVSDRDPDRRILVTGTEHDSVTATVAVLAKRGRDVRAIGVDRSGAPDLAAMETAAAERPALISLSLVNSETGRVAPLGAVAEIAGRTGALLHVDAVQALGKLPPEVIRAIPADLVTVSGHKIEGPKGVGVLAIKTDASIEPQISGGGQEFGLRSGTENVPAIVGFARAAELRTRELPEILARIEGLGRRLRATLAAWLPAEALHGAPADCSPFIVNFAVPGIAGDLLVQRFDLEGFEISAGSACGSGKVAPSPVLARMGVPYVSNAVRVSLGRLTTDEEIERFLATLRRLMEGRRG